MATPIVTSSRILEVVVATASDAEKKFNLDKPANNITLSQVNQAFSILINANDSDCAVFASRDGIPYIKFNRAAVIETTKVTTYLE